MDGVPVRPGVQALAQHSHVMAQYRARARSAHDLGSIHHSEPTVSFADAGSSFSDARSSFADARSDRTPSAPSHGRTRSQSPPTKDDDSPRNRRPPQPWMTQGPPPPYPTTSPAQQQAFAELVAAEVIKRLRDIKPVKRAPSVHEKVESSSPRRTSSEVIEHLSTCVVSHRRGSGQRNSAPLLQPAPKLFRSASDPVEAEEDSDEAEAVEVNSPKTPGSCGPSMSEDIDMIEMKDTDPRLALRSSPSKVSFHSNLPLVPGFESYESEKEKYESESSVPGMIRSSSDAGSPPRRKVPRRRHSSCDMSESDSIPLVDTSERPNCRKSRTLNMDDLPSARISRKSLGRSMTSPNLDIDEDRSTRQSTMSRGRTSENFTQRISGRSHATMPPLEEEVQAWRLEIQKKWQIPARRDSKKRVEVGYWAHLYLEAQAYLDNASFKKVVESSTFDYISASFIILNAITLGAQTDYESRNIAAPVPQVFRIFELCFCFIFTTEVSLRILAYRLSFFTMSNRRWNCFDVFVVLMQLLEEGVSLIAGHVGSDVPTSSSGSNLGAMRLLRVLRLVRIVRLVRIMHLIGELRILIASIFNSLRSLLWTLLLLTIMMYIVGVYFCQVVSQHLLMNRSDIDRVPELLQYFGSIDRSLISLFQSITGGLNWSILLQPLADHISVWMVLPFCAYVAFAVFAVLNIITGVFVENAMKSAKKDDDMYLLNQSRQLFLECCNDKGEVTWDAFQAELSNHNMESFFRAVGLSSEEAKFLFTLIDIDDSGSLQPDEFVNGCLRLRGQARAMDLAILMREVVSAQKQITATGMALTWMVQKMDEGTPDIPADTESFPLADLRHRHSVTSEIAAALASTVPAHAQIPQQRRESGFSTWSSASPSQSQVVSRRGTAHSIGAFDVQELEAPTQSISFANCTSDDSSATGSATLSSYRAMDPSRLIGQVGTNLDR